MVQLILVSIYTQSYSKILHYWQKLENRAWYMEAVALHQAVVPYGIMKPYGKLISPAQTSPFSSSEAQSQHGLSRPKCLSSLRRHSWGQELTFPPAWTASEVLFYLDLPCEIM